MLTTVFLPIFGSFFIPVAEALFPKKGRSFALLLGGVTFFSAMKVLFQTASPVSQDISFLLPMRQSECSQTAQQQILPVGRTPDGWT